MMAMQMIERPWGIAAHGAASVRSAPDLVRARFKVIRLEQTPSRAFAAATKAVHAVREALRAHQVADSAVERSRLDLKSSFSSYGAERKFLGYQCKASFALQSANLDDIQQLLVDVVAAGANEIEAVEFDVTTKTDLRAHARRQAVAAARSKADLFMSDTVQVWLLPRRLQKFSRPRDRMSGIRQLILRMTYLALPGLDHHDDRRSQSCG